MVDTCSVLSVISMAVCAVTFFLHAIKILAEVVESNSV